MKRGLILLLLTSRCLAPWSSQAAKPLNWRVFRLADGMPSVVCSAVTIDSQGKVLVSHADISTVTEFDGYSIRKWRTPLSDARRFYISPAGQLWALTRKGLNEYRDEDWVLHTPRELGLDMPLAGDWFDSPVMCPIRQGVVLLALPDRLIQFTSEPGHSHRIDIIKEAKDSALGQFNSIVPARAGGFWVSGSRGVARVQPFSRAGELQKGWEEFVAPADWQAIDFKSLHQGSGAVLTLVARSTTESNALLITTFNGQKWTRAWRVNEPIRHAWQGRGSTFWAITDRALLQYPEGESRPIEIHDFPVKRYFDVATEASSAFWLATSDGLLRYASLLWETVPRVGNIDSGMRYIAADPQGGIWTAGDKGLHWLNEGRDSYFPYPGEQVDAFQSARAIFPLRNGVVAIQTGEGLMTFSRDLNRYQWLRSVESDERWEAIGYVKESALAIRKKAARGEGGIIRTFDGAAFGRVTGFPENGLDGLTGFLLSQNGDIWTSGQWGTGWWHEGKWHSFGRGQNAGPVAVRCFIESSDGALWCAASEGVWQFDGKTWHLSRPEAEGANALVRTRDGSIWAGSKHGVARFWQGAWIEQGIEEGLPSLQVDALCEDRADHLWAASGNRICVFDPKADPDPPRTTVEVAGSKEAGLYEGASLRLLFNAADKWKSTVRSRLLYSYHLDGWAWSPFSGTDQATLSDLSAGKHYFQVRSMDRNGNIDPAPASFEFNVLVPWYRESRLMLISAIGAAAALFFAALALNRHRQLLRSYAEVEKKVAQRTLELEKANRELLQSQKMTALGTLAAGIAHDFNNILSIIKGSAQIIEENLHDSHKVETRLERIKTVVEQGAGIVKAMLGFSRESSQESEPCDVNETVNDTIRLLGDRFVREVEIRFEPEPGLPHARCSKELVQQILLNFLFNAVESAMKDRRITIFTRQTPSIPEGAVLLPASAKVYICVSVRDRGAGIDPEILPRVFEPFFTTKALSSRRGTGLGLSMAYEFARKLNAGLAVESRVGEGSTFTLLLPVTDPVPQTRAAQPGAQKASSGKAVVHP